VGANLVRGERPDVLLLVDAISSLGSLRCRVDDWGVDVVATGAGPWPRWQPSDRGGGVGGGVFRVGGGVSSPELVFKVKPEYSEQARKAKYQGTVVLYVEVEPNGRAQNMRVIQSLGLGLDEKAMEAVRKWTFRPGHKNGKPVTVVATVEVSFRLL
jgi:TonB family protein